MDDKDIKNSQQEKKETNADLLQGGGQSPLKQYQKYLKLYAKLNNFYIKNPNVFSDYDEYKKRFNYDTSNLQDQKLIDYFYEKYQSSMQPDVVQHINNRTAEQNNNSLNLDIF